MKKPVIKGMSLGAAALLLAAFLCIPLWRRGGAERQLLCGDYAGVLSERPSRISSATTVR
jgi:hypothetical protein